MNLDQWSVFHLEVYLGEMKAYYLDIPLDYTELRKGVKKGDWKGQLLVHTRVLHLDPMLVNRTAKRMAELWEW